MNNRAKKERLVRYCLEGAEGVSATVMHCVATGGSTFDSSAAEDNVVYIGSTRFCTGYSLERVEGQVLKAECPGARPSVNVQYCKIKPALMDLLDAMRYATHSVKQLIRFGSLLVVLRRQDPLRIVL